MTKLRYYFSMAIILLAMGLLLYGYYLAFWPQETVKLNKEPFTVKTKEVNAGEYLEYQLDFTKLKNIKPQVTYYLIDGSVLQLNQDGGVSRPVGRQIRNPSVLIPKATRPGKYHIQIDLVYQINPLRKLYYSWTSEEFYVK